MLPLPDLIDILAPVMRSAGRLIEAVREAGFETRGKADASPVTEADERAELLLTAALAAADPYTPIVGEEAHAAGYRPPPSDRFWLIDALDGTRDFIAGRPAYSVNIGLIDRGRPVLGLVLCPRNGMLWAGAQGHGAFRQAPGEGREWIAARGFTVPPAVVVSHSHLDAATKDYLTRLGLVELEPTGSSLKFCRLAEGTADVYPRYGPTMEWDTAAGHAILLAAGARCVRPAAATSLMASRATATAASSRSATPRRSRCCRNCRAGACSTLPASREDREGLSRDLKPQQLLARRHQR